MNELAASTPPPESFGRYLLYPAIARGGMATVHTARLVGADGFTRLVAAKRLHPELSEDPDFVTMFHDEACIASRIHHPNVVPVLDVVLVANELILVQEYVHGVPLSQLMRAAANSPDTPIPIDVVIALLAGVLSGLHAAHEVKDEQGHPLEIVHRDVSPANVMVSVDGTPKLLDFGIAKARTSTHHTREGIFKGKLAYMAPEQLRMDGVDRRADVYATGILAWELLVNRRVYDGRHELAFVTAVMNGEIPNLTTALADRRESMGEARWKDIVALEVVVSRAMAIVPDERFKSAEEMHRALLEVGPAATSMTVSDWVRTEGADYLERRQKMLSANEESSRRTSVYTPAPASGTQRVTVGGEAKPEIRSTIMPGPYRSTTTPTPTYPSSLAPSELAIVRGVGLAPELEPSAHWATHPSSPRRIVAAIRRSRSAPWIASGALILAGLIGGSLRITPEAPAPVAAAAPPPAASPIPTLAVAPIVVAPAAAPPASVAVTAAALPAPPSRQLFHAPTPAPPPPRFTPAPARPAAPPATAVSAPTSAPPASKSDCNPPFFFEGTKKIFKPSCL